MRYILIFILINNAYALSTFSKKEKKTIKKNRKLVKTSNSIPSKELDFYKARVRSLELMQKAKPTYPDIDDEFSLFNIGDLVGGKLMFSILSTNLGAPIVIIPDKKAGLPFGAKFHCQGSTKFKRVVGECNKLIIDGEVIPLSAQILADDGTYGLRGDFYSGQEEYVAGMIISEATKGLLAVQQTTLNTELGTVTTNTAKNAILQGLVNSADQTTDLLREQMQTKEPKVFVKSNTRAVLIINSIGEVR